MTNNPQLPPLPLIDGCLFVDNSGWVESLQTCPRYLQYKQLNKRISAEESSALNFGSALHLALEFRYRNHASQPIDAFYYDEIGPILTDFFALHPPHLDDHRTLNWAMEVIRHYNERYVVEPFSLLKYDVPRECPQCVGKGWTGEVDSNKGEVVKVPCPWCVGSGRQDLMVEMPFVLPLFEHEGIKIFYTGKIDLPFIRDSELFVCDHKTSSMLGKYFFIGKRLSSQLRGYCYAFQEITKRKVNGFCVNAIRSSVPPQWVTNGEAASKRGEKKSLSTWWNDTLQREFFRVSQDDLLEWKENTIATIKRFFWEYSQGFLPMNTESCVRYGKCQYHDVCTLPKADRVMLLHSGLYKDNLWTPLVSSTQSKQ